MRQERNIVFTELSDKRRIVRAVALLRRSVSAPKSREQPFFEARLLRRRMCDAKAKLLV